MAESVSAATFDVAQEEQRRRFLALLANPEEAMQDQLRAMHYNPGAINVRFFGKAMLDVDESVKAGRPIFTDREMIESKIPGNKDEIRVREVRWYDREFHANEYAAFKNKRTATLKGTPLELLPYLSDAQREEFRFHNISTAEQLRDLSDTECQRFPGIHEVKRKTHEYLQATAGAAPVTALQAKLDAQADQLREAMAQLAALREQVAAKAPEQPKKKG